MKKTTCLAFGITATTDALAQTAPAYLKTALSVDTRVKYLAGRPGRATVFSQAIGLAVTFNHSLAHAVAAVISDKAWAMYNAAAKRPVRQRRLQLN